MWLDLSDIEQEKKEAEIEKTDPPNNVSKTECFAVRGPITTCRMADDWNKQQHCRFSYKSDYVEHCGHQMIGSNACKSMEAQKHIR